MKRARPKKNEKGFIRLCENAYAYIQSNGRKGNFFIVFYGDRIMLVDTGGVKDFIKISRFLNSVGYTVSDITDIFVTHADGDHVGSVKELVKHSGATVWASQKTKEYLARAYNPMHFPFPINMIAHLVHKFNIGKNNVDIIVSEQEEIDLFGGIKVLFTPGHTDDHVCYFMKEYGILFAGDCLMNVSRLKLPPSILNWDNNELVNSVQKLIDLPVTFLCVGHGGVCDYNRSDDMKKMDEFFGTSIVSEGLSIFPKRIKE